MEATPQPTTTRRSASPVLYASTPYGNELNRHLIGMVVSRLLDEMLLSHWADIVYPPKEPG